MIRPNQQQQHWNQLRPMRFVLSLSLQQAALTVERASHDTLALACIESRLQNTNPAIKDSNQHKNERSGSV